MAVVNDHPVDGGKQRLQQRLFSPTLTIALNCGFARGRPIRIIICKRPVPPNDYLNTNTMCNV